ncbi:hypothetical protein HaLaN_23697 [Haematococcus lacustris]|uniref:Uncharacterized protein n=1 Tax=Haematococcus lacustris TaxID=44745 RepID=A0A6A0A4J0_HAELA|nr:hypothetical protein HaLaN_23697 [Haematococcus lacustris]
MFDLQNVGLVRFTPQLHFITVHCHEFQGQGLPTLMFRHLLRLWSGGWLGSAGHPQDIAQCRRALGALRIGAAASPRGAQAPQSLLDYSTCQQPTLAGPAAYHHLPAPPHCPSA